MANRIQGGGQDQGALAGRDRPEDILDPIKSLAGRLLRTTSPWRSLVAAIMKLSIQQVVRIDVKQLDDDFPSGALLELLIRHDVSGPDTVIWACWRVSPKNARNKATATGWSSGSNCPSHARVGSAFKNAELSAKLPHSHVSSSWTDLPIIGAPSPVTFIAPRKHDGGLKPADSRRVRTHRRSPVGHLRTRAPTVFLPIGRAIAMSVAHVGNAQWVSCVSAEMLSPRMAPERPLIPQKRVRLPFSVAHKTRRGASVGRGCRKLESASDQLIH